MNKKNNRQELREYKVNAELTYVTDDIHMMAHSQREAEERYLKLYMQKAEKMARKHFISGEAVGTLVDIEQAGEKK